MTESEINNNTSFMELREEQQIDLEGRTFNESSSEKQQQQRQDQTETEIANSPTVSQHSLIGSVIKKTATELAINILLLGVLFGLAYATDTINVAIVSISIQVFTFVFFAAPWYSERFYDLSGSLTHMTLVLFSLLSASNVRTDLRIMNTATSLIWATRLGTFLFGRIVKDDGTDHRFDKLKSSPLSFFIVWNMQGLCLFWFFIYCMTNFFFFSLGY